MFSMCVCVSKLEHICNDNETPEQGFQRTFDVLCKRILVVEERPVVTRFFLFTSCVNTLLAMDLMKLLPDIWMQVHGVRPQEDNAKRLHRIRCFFSSPSTPANLRRAVLCLRLTSHVVHICSQKNKPGSKPLLIRLAQGEIQKKCSEDLMAILPLLHLDSKISITSTFVALMVTAAEILLRFQIFDLFPARLWTLSKKYNPLSFRAAIVDFVSLPDTCLDVGYSAALQAEALEQGALEQQVRFLLSPAVQSELDRILETALVNNLDVERKHWQDKRPENSSGKVASLSRCSRNSLIRKYRLQRSEVRLEQLKVKKRFAKDRFANARSIAVARHPEWLPRPRGILHWQQGVAKQQAKTIGHQGNPEALQQYLQENKASLQEEAAQRRQAAKRGLTSLEASRLPMSNAEWLRWVEANEAYFHDILRSATETRRELSRRLVCENATWVYLDPFSFCDRFCGIVVPSLIWCFACDCNTIFRFIRTPCRQSRDWLPQTPLEVVQLHGAAHCYNLIFVFIVSSLALRTQTKLYSLLPACIDALGVSCWRDVLGVALLGTLPNLYRKLWCL